MPATMNYPSLVTDMQGYQERVDQNYINQIPRLVMMAENRIATDAQILGYLTPMTGTLLSGAFSIPKPSFWRQTVSMNFTNAAGKVTPLYERTYEYVRNYWPSPTQVKPPKFYADYDFNNWLIAPSADQQYTFEIMVYVRRQPLDNAQQTNWLTDNAPQLLLSACMYEAQLWAKNFDRVDFWSNEYTKHLASFTKEDLARDTDRQVLIRSNNPSTFA